MMRMLRVVSYEISTHSLTRRLTVKASEWKVGTKVISTHSLTRRLTADRIKSINFAVYFNSQPHKEADR